MDPRWKTRAQALGVLTVIALVVAVFSSANDAPAATPAIVATIVLAAGTAACVMVATMKGARGA